MKICGTCRVEKPLENFPPNKKNKDGLNTKCRECYNAYMKAWYAKNKEIHRARVATNRPKVRAAKYGLTPVEVDAMIATYDGKCWLCKIKPATEIDHCHDTGRVRGVLCFDCNTGLGKLGDTVESLKRAVEYLRG